MGVDKLFEVKNISFSYDDEEIFSDISFSLDKGDVLIEGEVRSVFSSPLIAKPSPEIIASHYREKGINLPFPILTLRELADEYQKEIEK